MTTAALLVGLLDRTRPSQRPYHAEISLMATGFRVDAIRLIALKFELLDDSPRSDPDCRILKSGNNLQRSTICRFSRAPWKSVFWVKFVTSTTSVSPSHWLRESPHH